MPEVDPVPNQVRFGLVPHVDDDATREAFDRLCALLAKDLGTPVVPCRAGSPMALASLLRHGELHFAWMSPTLAMLTPELEGIVPLLSSVRQGVAAFNAVVFTSESSPIRSLGDLEGSTVAWVARTSASGYIVPRLALARRGLDLRGLFAREIFCDSHGAVAWAVKSGGADVGATYAVFEGGDTEGQLLRAGFIDYLPGFEVRILEASGPIPADMIVGGPRVDHGLCSRFAASLSRLVIDPADGAPVRRIMGAEAFRPCAPESLRAIEELVVVARNGGILEPPARR